MSMMKCVNKDCQYFREHGKCSEECTKRGITKIVTNADKIRNMSDEELAEVLPILFDLMCQPTDECMKIMCNHGECSKLNTCAMKWLKSEADT